MSLGYDREDNVVNLNDTAEVVAFLYDKQDSLYCEDDLVGATFTIQKPSGDLETVDGEITGEGEATAYFEGTDEVGHYTAIATFETVEQGKKSARADFEAIDPFAQIIPSPSFIVASLTWDKLEDCFDGQDEGPWLKEMTLNYFNKNKMEAFIAETLFDINQQNPPTALDLSAFVVTPPDTDPDPTPYPTADAPLLAQGTLIAVIRHLIRSYVEQPNPVGAQIAWHDRRDYLQRWQTVLQIEQEQYRRMLALWKRKYLGLGSSKLLIGVKAGRISPTPLRTWMVGRSWIW